MEIAFLIRPIYKNNAAEGEAIDNSLGISATIDPTRFLELVNKYKISDNILEFLVLQTSIDSIDSLKIHRKEWNLRIQALSSVKEPLLFPLRDKSISFVQAELKRHTDLPDDAWGK